jgi:asparagine synthase (glutamine-hydrolysing)
VVDRVDGMFAFGVWDQRSRRLLLARDRPGKKPLFYVEHEGRFMFASEMKAFFAAGVPADPDPRGVSGFLAYGYAPPPGTVYRSISQLPPASRLILEPSRPPRVQKYWQLDFTNGPRPASEAEAGERIQELLTAAVRKRLVADVPVGAFLSGGLDSTIVVGLMSRLGHRVRTFSIGFSGDPRYDETEYARIAARVFGSDHSEFTVRPSDFELVDKLVWHHDGPFGDSSAIPTYVVSRLTRAQVTVALTGDGGDELFAGYTRFWAAQATERIPGPLRRLGAIAAKALPAGGGSRTFLARARRLLRAGGRPLGDRLTEWNSYFAFSLSDILQPEMVAGSASVLDFHQNIFSRSKSQSVLSKSLQHNFETYLPGDLLVKMDRTSMAHALETRSPFLDTALMEFVATLPDDYKLRGRTTKYILRKAFADLMPPQIRGRGKMGFGLPLGAWFRRDLRDYISDHLASPVSRITEFVRPQAVSRIISDHMEGRADNEHQLWALLTLEIWLRDRSRLSRAWQDPPAEEPLPAALSQ